MNIIGFGLVRHHIKIIMKNEPIVMESSINNVFILNLILRALHIIVNISVIRQTGKTIAEYLDKKSIKAIAAFSPYRNPNKQHFNSCLKSAFQSSFFRFSSHNNTLTTAVILNLSYGKLPEVEK